MRLLLAYLCVLLLLAVCLLWCVRRDERDSHAEQVAGHEKRVADLEAANEALARRLVEPMLPARVPVSEQQWQQVVSAFVRPDATDCPPAERGPS